MRQIAETLQIPSNLDFAEWLVNQIKKTRLEQHSLKILLSMAELKEKVIDECFTNHNAIDKINIRTKKKGFDYFAFYGTSNGTVK